MNITTFGLKVWRWLSILGVVGALAWTYSVLPDLVAVDFDQSGLIEASLGKEMIFYIAMGVIILANTLLLSLAKQLPRIPIGSLPVPSRGTWAAFRDELDEHLTNAAYALVAAINTLLGLSLFALGTVNSSSFNLSVFDFAWVYYLAMGMLGSILVSLPLRLYFPPSVPSDL